MPSVLDPDSVDAQVNDIVRRQDHSAEVLASGIRRRYHACVPALPRSCVFELSVLHRQAAAYPFMSSRVAVALSSHVSTMLCKYVLLLAVFLVFVENMRGGVRHGVL